MLAASTNCSVKLFRLRRRKSDYNDSLKVQSMDVPKPFRSIGAKIVQFSPDCKWLAIIQMDDSVRLDKIVRAAGESAFLEGDVQLKRLTRGPIAKTLHQGSLGDYDRSITRLSFSSDSRILAVADLSGFLDSWILKGHEDLTLGSDKDTKVAKSPESSDSSDDGDREESDSGRIYGQRWRRNPTAVLLPKLKTAPLVLSFRPPRSSPCLAIADDSGRNNPTHQNTRLHAHGLPGSSDRLFVLTTSHSMHEFEILSGRISDWSRRNPTSNLPTTFRGLRDRAMSCVWDTDRDSPRIWLYGISWLWMFDFSVDLPPPVKHEAPKKEDKIEANGDYPAENGGDKNKKTRKRRREARDQITKVLRGRGTGAGSRIPDGKLTSGIGRKVLKLGDLADGESRWALLEQEASPISDVDDDEVNNSSALVKLRRDGVDGEMIHNDDNVRKFESGHQLNGAPQPGEEKHEARQSNVTLPHWHTLKYRPILGIVTISGENLDLGEDTIQGDDDASVYGGLEVALVERPMWDVDLPPRYHGDQEWDK